MKNKKNIFQNKIFIVFLGILLFLGASSGTFFYLRYTNGAILKSTANSVVDSNKTTVKTTIKDTATSAITTPVTESTTNDSLQSDLNNTNPQTSSLESEVNSATTGLSDQQTNLTY